MGSFPARPGKDSRDTCQNPFIDSINGCYNKYISFERVVMRMEQEDNKGSELNAHDAAVSDRKKIRRLANLGKPAPPHRDPSKASSDVPTHHVQSLSPRV
jgi:hypothetical protein